MFTKESELHCDAATTVVLEHRSANNASWGQKIWIETAGKEIKHAQNPAICSKRSERVLRVCPHLICSGSCKPLMHRMYKALQTNLRPLCVAAQLHNGRALHESCDLQVHVTKSSYRVHKQYAAAERG